MNLAFTLPYLTLWLLTCNALCLLWPKLPLKIRFLAIPLALGSLFGLGLYLDTHLTNQPHSAYTNWETYAIFLSLSLVFALPALTYLFYKKGA